MAALEAQNGGEATSKDMESFMKKLDTNKDGELSLEEFKAMF